MKYGLIVSLGLSIGLLSACTPPTRIEQARQPVLGSGGIRCTNEVATGSVLRERKCTTAQEREEQRRQAEHQAVIEPGPGAKNPR